MSAFVFTTNTHSPDAAQYESACLGAAANAKLTDNDVGKALKLGTAENYVLCATTNEIEAILVSVEPETYNSGFAFGTVQRRGRAIGKVGANQGGTAMAVGDLVTADTQEGVDTAGGLVVKTGTPATHKWRVLRIISGTGVAGDSVLIERV